MRAHVIAPEERIQFVPRVTPSARPILDARRALVALGDIAGAADRRSLRDLWAGWRAYLEAVDRSDLLLVDPLAEPVPMLLSAREGFRLIVDQILATARNLDARDAERHWQEAARLMVRAAQNAAAYYSVRVRHAIEVVGQVATAVREGWEDPVPEVDPHEVASAAEHAAHWARIAAGHGLVPVLSNALRAVGRAKLEMDLAIERALTEAAVLQPRPGAHPDEPLLECRVCGDIDSHRLGCPLAELTASALLGRYETTLGRRN